VTTSFIAVYLTARRSPFYAIAYAANDIVLIILWLLASISNPEYVTTVACFIVFLINDIYGFISWRRMEKRQSITQ
jgi:nicotinamide riboside transporter PnuC